MDLISIKYIFLLVAISFGNQVFSQANDIVLRNASLFINTPYKAHTLEVNNTESLIINQEEVDCTTFVEYVLAMSLSNCHTKTTSDSAFVNYLRCIRYRDGNINGYTSRLHYMSEWIDNIVNQGLVSDITSKYGSSEMTLSLSYMSSNPHYYAQLKNSPSNLSKMKAIETTLNGKKVRWLPSDSISLHGPDFIEDGDIIMITTNIKGLDIAHVGFTIYNQSNELCLLHASSRHKKVVIDSQPLKQLLIGNSKWTGIRVLRMNTSHP